LLASAARPARVSAVPQGTLCRGQRSYGLFGKSSAVQIQLVSGMQTREDIFFMSPEGEKVPIRLADVDALTWRAVAVRQLRELIFTMATPESCTEGRDSTVTRWHPRVPRRQRPAPALLSRDTEAERRHSPPSAMDSDGLGIVGPSDLYVGRLSSQQGSQSAGGAPNLPLRLGGVLLEDGRELGFYRITAGSVVHPDWDTVGLAGPWTTAALSYTDPDWWLEIASQAGEYWRTVRPPGSARFCAPRHQRFHLTLATRHSP
jgi:hypothetical protein